MNASVPGAGSIIRRIEVRFLDLLRDLFRTGQLKRDERYLVELVIKYFEAPEIMATIDEKIAVPALRAVAESRMVSPAHRDALNDAANMIIIRSRGK